MTEDKIMHGKFRSGNAPGFIVNIPYICTIPCVSERVSESVSHTLVVMAMTEV